ncbi:MAG: hypothetical protein ACRCZF_25385, partial [Gemmataceae bacterium]
LVAVAFVVVQTFTEIPITDSMMVRTYAEEVYTQLIVGPDRVPEAVASTFPGVLLVVCMMAYLQRTWVGPQPDTTATDTPLLRRGRPAGIVFFLGILTLIVVVLPLVAITVPLRWWRDPGTAHRILTDALIAHGSPLISSLLAAVATGVLTTALAILAVYRTRPHRIDRRILELFAMLIWAMPGPLVGLGLKTIILWLVRLNDAVPALPFAALLYDQPSALPGIWVNLLRTFPLAFVLIDRAMRNIPAELYDQAALDGRGTFRWVVWPQVWPNATGTVFIIAALALGEVSASKLVLTPGRQEYILDLFSQMHYGAEGNVAAMSVWLVLFLIVGRTIVWWRWR